MKQLILIGFWAPPRIKSSGLLDAMLISLSTLTHANLPDPKNFIDLNWSATERAAIIGYLRLQKTTQYYFGDSTCRICSKQNGNAEQSDGVYLWPSGYVHYLEDHGVKPDVSFIEHVLGGRV